MKKLTHLIVGAMLVLAPLSASALETLSADSMKAATGQAGVSIAIDDVILYQNTGDTTYVDNDGTTGLAADAAGVEITGAESLLQIQAIIVGNEGASGNDYRTLAPAWDEVGKPLTIDVGTCTALTAMHLDGGGAVGSYIAGVAIGLPTIEIYDSLANASKVISLVQSGAANNGDEFIEIQTTGNTIAILGGTLEIAPH
jgi:hypothetical protein